MRTCYPEAFGWWQGRGDGCRFWIVGWVRGEMVEHGEKLPQLPPLLSWILLIMLKVVGVMIPNPESF